MLFLVIVSILLFKKRRNYSTVAETLLSVQGAQARSLVRELDPTCCT